MTNVFISLLHCMHWCGFPVLVVPSIAWETVSTGWVSCCCVDPRRGHVVALCGMAPLASPFSTGTCLLFSADCPVPRHSTQVIYCIPEAVSEAWLTSFSILMDVKHFIPSARFVDGIGREFSLGSKDCVTKLYWTGELFKQTCSDWICITNYMGQSPLWDADSHSADQGINLAYKLSFSHNKT
jgi:hypothetical protein